MKNLSLSHRPNATQHCKCHHQKKRGTWDFFFKRCIIIYMCIWPVCMHVCIYIYTCHGAHRSQKRKPDPLKSELKVVEHQPPCGYWKTDPDPLQKQQIFFESSLQSPFWVSKIKYAKERKKKWNQKTNYRYANSSAEAKPTLKPWHLVSFTNCWSCNQGTSCKG